MDARAILNELQKVALFFVKALVRRVPREFASSMVRKPASVAINLATVARIEERCHPLRVVERLCAGQSVRARRIP